MMSDLKKKYTKPILVVKEGALEYERCVLCGKKTEIPVILPVQDRNDYVVGIGQLCYECVKKLRDCE